MSSSLDNFLVQARTTFIASWDSTLNSKNRVKNWSSEMLATFRKGRKLKLRLRMAEKSSKYKVSKKDLSIIASSEYKQIEHSSKWAKRVIMCLFLVKLTHMLFTQPDHLLLKSSALCVFLFIASHFVIGNEYYQKGKLL